MRWQSPPFNGLILLYPPLPILTRLAFYENLIGEEKMVTEELSNAI